MPQEGAVPHATTPPTPHPGHDASRADARPQLLDDEARQLRLLIDGVVDYAIYMIDTEGYLRSWNTGGERIKGYTASEVIGTHFSRFYTPEDAASGAPARGLRIARDEGRFTAEGWRVRKDGSRFHASVVIDPIWEEGELIGYAKVTRDTTERFRHEARLDHARDALLQSQKLEAIGKLTLGLAHDFNNLLNIIINSLELVDHYTPEPKAKRHLQGAMRAAERGALLTRQLLTFGKGHALVAERHAVERIIDEAMDTLQRACREGVTLHARLEDGLPEIDVDREQLEAALLNLVSNSRDAMPAGGHIAITATLRHCAPPYAADQPASRFVCIEVSDDGEGIAADDLARVFEPFFTTKDIGKGSGLGLSQVFGFARQSGGFADLKSTPGAGTTVSVCLPVPRESE
ncbi:MAG: PAS domain S-box protein [Pseudoxanthomonas mexicana]|nr:PAS domain S-box protein [Pseudoxanthomonas mexicana]